MDRLIAGADKPMSEHDFLVNVRRLLLSAVAMIDKRIEWLKGLQPVKDENGA